jgi:hypothetical protein
MKAKCPVCGIEGFVEKRGSSVRILHYNGFMNGRRVYEKHSITFSDSQLIPNTMGINNLSLGSELNSVGNLQKTKLIKVIQNHP